MSTRLQTAHKTNTSHINHLLTDPMYLQIMDLLAHEPLTFPELAEVMVRKPKQEEVLSTDLNNLVQEGVVKRHFHNHKVNYALAGEEFRQTAHILYELWAQYVRA